MSFRERQRSLSTAFVSWRCCERRDMPAAQRSLVFRPPGTGWARSHAQNPFAEDRGCGLARIHFACRDEQNRSRGAAIDVSWDALAEARLPATIEPRMTLDLGELGAFDDAGAMPHSAVAVGE